MNKKITIKDFQKLDIRVGTVTHAEVPEWSHWVMKLEVDLGKEIGKLNVFAGIMKFFKPQELVGKQLPFLVNLEPKKIGPEGDMSQAMLLAANLPAEKEEDEKPILFEPTKKVPNGVKVH